MEYTISGLHAMVENALREFFRHDKQLLHIDANERSITHKLAEHLQRQFVNLNVDCEYNRRGGDPKKLVVDRETNCTDDLDAKTVYPDIIIHKRGHDCSNELVIEVKKTNGRGSTHDERKLRAFTKSGGDYGYRMGLLLVFDVDNQALKRVECFHRDEWINPCCCCGSLVEKFASAE